MRSHALLDDLQVARSAAPAYRRGRRCAEQRAGRRLHRIRPDRAEPAYRNLLVVMLLVRLQQHGHRPVALVGGGTGLIGDPSGKASERPMADAETVAANTEPDPRSSSSAFSTSAEPNAARMIDNAEWLAELRAVDFMRDVGKHFTVNYMLQKDSVQEPDGRAASRTPSSRTCCCRRTTSSSCGAGMTCAADGRQRPVGQHHRRHRADSPRRGADAHAITAPLVTTPPGAKFGKTEAGAVWLDAALTSPYKFYQFWVNVDDRDAGRYLRFFTLLSREEIEALERRTAAAPGAARGAARAGARRHATRARRRRARGGGGSLEAAVRRGRSEVAVARRAARAAAGDSRVHASSRTRSRRGSRRTTCSKRCARAGCAVQEQGRHAPHAAAGRRLPERPAAWRRNDEPLAADDLLGGRVRRSCERGRGATALVRGRSQHRYRGDAASSARRAPRPSCCSSAATAGSRLREASARSVASVRRALAATRIARPQRDDRRAA